MTVAGLSKLRVGEEVGFALGKREGESSKHSEKTKLLFVTYGYAIQSGLIDSAEHIVLDEVHESSEEISLARAILHKRLEQGAKVNILEMSATVDAQKQADYWADVNPASITYSEGKTFNCENRATYPSQKTLAQVALDLIMEDARNGIAIFRPGKG